MFDFNLSDKLKLKMKALAKRDRKKVQIINKKIREVINNDEETVQRYKNLQYGLKHLKRVHIDKNFVLTFRVDLQKNFIWFTDFEHHDRIYKR